MPKPKSKSGYKTKRKYGCPYCSIKLPRGELVTHVQDEHEIMIPEDYTAARAVYDHINGKNFGTCMICGTKVYEWDDRVWRYKNLCDNPNCRKKLTEKAKNNRLDDPEKQKVMLQGRKISGEYTFTDGGKRGYVGSYEKKTLEFMDKVMGISSDDIATPGPTFTYEYDGSKHAWITDIFYIPAMLVIDVKDGGNNPNTRPMESYREKQIEKEKAIIEDGRYNYLRLTDNDFGQLLSAIADIRYGDIINDPEKGIYINENAANSVMVGTVKPYGRDYIIPRTTRNAFTDEEPDTFIFGNTLMDKGFMIDDEGELVVDEISKLLEATRKNKIEGKNPKVGNKKFRKIVFHKDKSAMAKLADKLKENRAKQANKNKSKAMMEMELASIMAGKTLLTYSNIYHLDNATIVEVDIDSERKSVLNEIFTILGMSNSLQENTFVRPIGKHMSLMYTADGDYYVSSEDPTYNIASDYYADENDIPQNIIDLMDDLYEANKKKVGDKNE